MSGYSSCGNSTEDKRCVAQNGDLNRLNNFIKDAQKLGELDLLKVKASNKLDILAIKPFSESNEEWEVRPADLATWLHRRAITRKIIRNDFISVFFPKEPKTADQPVHYITAEMQLLNDAAAKFWMHYDLSKPDISKSYPKKEITDWLKNEANKRGFDLSDNIANAIDTIIRCPKSRKGGNTY